MKVRLGIIGCGAIGQRRHIPDALCLPDKVEIVALCDIREDRVREVAAKNGVSTTYTDHRKMLDNEHLDAIVVGTPNACHAPQTIDGFKAGCHVLVEKPMAGSLAEAKAMIAAARKAGKFLMVGQNQRLAPPHMKAREILASGMLGKPLAFETSFKHPGPDSWSVDGAKSWFFRREEAIMGVCGDLGVHKIDLMRYLLGQEIVAVTGFVSTLDKTYPGTKKPIDVDDNAFLSVKTNQGVIGTITISWTNYGQMEDNGTTIYCEKGVLLIARDPQFGVVVHHRNGNKDYYKVGALATNERQTRSGIMDMFIGGILSGKAPPIDGEEGYRSLEVILGAMESSRSGKTVRCKGL
jgi:predicted dehydrogenase